MHPHSLQPDDALLLRLHRLTRVQRPAEPRRRHKLYVGQTQAAARREHVSARCGDDNARGNGAVSEVCADEARGNRFILLLTCGYGAEVLLGEVSPL